jgi:DNA-binding GntR family transcriptional regulator
MSAKTEIKTRRGNPSKTGVGTRAIIKTPLPLYLQIARALKEEIVSGVYPVGSLLPTEGDLSDRFAVSRYTVREALRRLREDSLVSSRQGAGTTVVPPRASHSYIHHVASINDLLTFAVGLRFAIDSIKTLQVDKRLAARTGLSIGQEWLSVKGFKYAEDVEFPVCWSEYFINREFAAVGRLLQRHTGPIFPLIEDLFGQNIAEVHQEIFSALISPALAGGLNVEPGSAVLEVRRTYKMTNEKIAQVTISVHPASRFHHSMTMRRVKS